MNARVSPRGVMAFLTIALASLLIAARTAPPEARTLLERVSATYRALRSYHVEGVMRLDTDMLGHRQSVDMPLMVAEARPGRGRSEMRNPMFGVIRVANGVHSWTYLPALGEYSHDTTSTVMDSSGASTVTAGTPLARYAALGHGLLHSEVVRREAVRLEGRRVDCWVIAARYQAPGADSTGAPTFLWIDRTRNVVLRESVDVQLGTDPAQGLRMSQVIRYSRVRVNQRVPDSLFVFRPPPGAREVTRLSAWGETADSVATNGTRHDR